MSQVLYSATVSLNGYIAGSGGDMSWLRPHLQPNPLVEQLQQEIGALPVGGRLTGETTLTAGLIRKAHSRDLGGAQCSS